MRDSTSQDSSDIPLSRSEIIYQHIDADHIHLSRRLEHADWLQANPKQKSMKSLSICIPTYKRPEMLKRCVESAVQSAGNRPITIFIADDSQTDINQEVLSDLTSIYPVVHQWNADNLGIDRNIQRVLALADGDYLWLIGEDDQFLPDAVARIFDLLQSLDHPFIFSNYQYVSEDHSRVLGLAISEGASGVLSASDFIEESLWSVGFIGSCIIRRADWQKTSPEPYDGTYYTHVGRILDILARNPSLYFSIEPAVANRAEGRDTFTWKKDSFGVFLGFEKMCRIAAERNVAMAKSILNASKKYRARFAYFSLKTVLRLRSEGAFDLRQFKTYVRRSDIGYIKKLLLFAMATVPPLLLKPVVILYSAYIRAVR